MTSDTITTYEQAIDWEWKKIRHTLIDRQRKYGHRNIERSGERGLLVRLNDKLARMENLLDYKEGERDQFFDESAEDTVIDIAGYGIIWAMWMDGLWGKFPLEEDLPRDSIGQKEEARG